MSAGRVACGCAVDVEVLLPHAFGSDAEVRQIVAGCWAP